MCKELLTAVSFLLLLLVQQVFADEESPAQPEQAVEQAPKIILSAKEQAKDAVGRLINATAWREVKAIQEELAAIGESAVHPILRQAKRHEDEKVRLWCYELLTRHFANEAKEFIAEKGLRDKSEKIRYLCAWHCGEAKSYGAHRTLRRLMEDTEQPAHVRNAAIKSLAELGEPDVIKQLINMMANDYYMPRHMGNLAAKALTGKNLNDLNGYEYGEGAFVSGGVEAVMMNPYPPAIHDQLAKRHQALADYCRWLEKEKPEVFKHLYAPW